MTEKEGSSERAEELYNKGVMALETNQYDYAITLFKSALSINPNFARAHEGMKMARARKLQTSSFLVRKMRAVGFLIQAFIFEKMGKWERTLEKFESLFTLVPRDLHLLPHLGDTYRENGMTDSAITTYKEFLEKEKDNIEVMKKLGSLYLDGGQMTEARAIYDGLLRIAPDDDEIAKEIKDAYARITIERGRWEEEVSFRKKTKEGEELAAGKGKAVEVKAEADEAARLKKSLERDPDDLELRRKLTELYRDMGQIDEAIDQCKRMVNHLPQDASLRQLLAGLYVEKNLLTEAVKEYELVSRLQPENGEVRRLLADLYIKQESFIKATKAYERIAKEEPADIKAHEMLGELYARTRYFDQAIAEYEKAAMLDPKKVNTQETLGNLYVRRGKLEKAIEKYRKVISLDPRNLHVYEILGDIYSRRKMFSEAGEVYEEILRIDPGHQVAEGKLKDIEIFNLGEVVSRYERILKENPEDGEVKKKLAEVKERKLTLGIDDREKRLQRDSENLTLRFELGSLYKEKGEVDKALSEFQMAVKDPQRKVQCLNMIGLCFEDKGMLDLATNQFQKAAEDIKAMTEEKKEILYNLGRVYEKRDLKDKAMEVYKDIYEVDIQYKDVARKTEELYGK